jgi:hypothetical protein
LRRHTAKGRTKKISKHFYAQARKRASACLAQASEARKRASGYKIQIKKSAIQSLASAAGFYSYYYNNKHKKQGVAAPLFILIFIIIKIRKGEG